ncbi:PAS domain-containing protein [Pseudooceanicola nanhaiensis]|uniref:PAS domain-containing protein n=1 Tax=Pseudooceanicola nanhaiensis TaxID=375761 RepID=UPI003512378E
MDTRNIIDMSAFLQDNRHPAIREVEGYWQALRAGRLVPRRSEVDPRGIERALEFAFILERIAPGLARMRIAGSHLSELMGMEVRGMPLSAFFTPDGRAICGEVLEQVFDTPAVAELKLEAERGMGKPAVEAKMLLLPLKSDLGDITRALGVLSTQGEIGRTPRRFDIMGQRISKLLDDTVAAPKFPAAPLPGFAEPAPQFAAAPRPGERAYLRLVQDDDAE